MESKKKIAGRGEAQGGEYIIYIADSSPFLFPKPKNPGRVTVGALNRSPKNKQKCSVKLQILQIEKMANAFWVRAFLPTN